MVLLALLASLAFPSYRDYQRNGYRSAAIADLGRCAQALERNRARLGIKNLEVFAGQAPADLAKLAPAPDRVVLEVGRPLGDVLRAVWDAMAPAGRLVISTTSLEGLVDATDHLGQLAANDVQVSQATVHRMVRRSNQTRLAAAEPLFVIAAERHP